MLHGLFASWFHLIEDWGYAGVFVLMAIESTVVPLPSELIMPPAAYWAAQGRMSFWGVVVAGTLGSWAGASTSYVLARALGRPLLLRFGRYAFLPERKWLLAEAWIRRYGAPGIFFARLLPVVRHLVSLPAGAARVDFLAFSVLTLIGSFAWCAVLSWFGARVLADEPALLSDPSALAHVLHDKLLWLVAATAVLALLYVVVVRFGRRGSAGAAAAGPAMLE